MGWFSSKRKTVTSLSFNSLTDSPFGEYFYVRKQLAFAAKGHSRVFGKELWRYKHDFRKHFNDKELVKLDVLPTTQTAFSFDAEDIFNYLVNVKEVENLYEIREVLDKEKLNGSYVTTSTNVYLVSDYVQVEEEESSYDTRISYGGNWEYYRNSNSTPEEGKDLLSFTTEPHFVIGDDGSGASVILSLDYSYKIYEYELLDPEDEESELIRVQQSVGSISYNMEKFSYAVVDYTRLDHIVQNGKDVPRYGTATVPYSFYTSWFTTAPISELQFAPILQLKGDDEPIEIKRKQERMLDIFGVEMDSVQSMIDNGDVDDFRLSLAIAPDECNRSSVVSKYLYTFFDSVTGDDSFPSNPISNRNRTVTFSLDDIDITYNFSLVKSTHSGTIPVANDYIVTLIQNITNAQKYYLDVKETYEEYMGSAGSKTTKDMYFEIVAAYSEGDEAYEALPVSDCWKNSKPKKKVLAYCTSANIEESIHSDLYYKLDPEEDEETKIFDIISYKIFNVSTYADKYYGTSIIDGLTVEVVHPKTGAITYNNYDSAIVEVSFQHSPSSYTKYTYGYGSIDYKIDDEKVATIRHDKADGSFRFFLTHDYLKGLKFREFTSIYGMSLCGVSYVTETIKIKWYQTASFAMLLRFVGAVITIVTAGAGAAVSTIIIGLVGSVAITVISLSIAKAIGGTAGTVIAVITAVVLAVLVNGGVGNDISSLWLTTGDTYMKAQLQQLQIEAKEMKEAYEEYKDKIDKKMSLLQSALGSLNDKGYSKEAILTNIANKAYYSGHSSILFNIETADKLDDEDWKLLELTPLDYDSANTLYNNSTTIPRSSYEFEQRMHSTKEFGDLTTK